MRTGRTTEALTVDQKVGNRLRMRRKMLKLSQRELGERIGVQFQQIQKYENGANRISAGRLQAFAELLGVPPWFFFEDLPTVAASSVEADRDVARFLITTDGLALAKAFTELTDPRVRRRIVALVEAIATSGEDDRNI